MNGIKMLLAAIGRSRFLKYALVVMIGVALVGFVGENSILSHVQNKVRISELDDEIGRYRELYEADRQKMDRLDRDPKAIEEIARERYFMKHADEDIFVFNEGGAELDTTSNERVK
ncbi:MAG: septum formation initiator family protein [Prevotella sp.]